MTSSGTDSELEIGGDGGLEDDHRPPQQRITSASHNSLMAPTSRTASAVLDFPSQRLDSASTRPTSSPLQQLQQQQRPRTSISVASLPPHQHQAAKDSGSVTGGGSHNGSQTQAQPPINVVDASIYIKAKKEIEKLEWTVNRYLKELNEAKTALNDKEYVIGSLYAKIQQLEQQIAEKQLQMTETEEQVAILKEQEWLAQRATAKMESEIQSSRAYSVKINQLLEESTQKNEVIKKNSSELESTRRRCNHYRLVIEAMEKELRVARESTLEMNTLRDEVRTLKGIGIVKERENLQMKNALQMLEAWFSDYDQMAKHDFSEIKRRAIDGVTYPEGVDGDKYDQFFRRERIKREEEQAAAKAAKEPHRIPGMHRNQKKDDNDSDAGSGTKRSGSQTAPVQSYLDLGTIPADVSFNLIEHIRDLVSTEDNFLLDHVKVGLRVQIRLDRVVIPTGGMYAGPVADSNEVITARHLPTSSPLLNRAKTSLGMMRSSRGSGGSMSARTSSAVKVTSGGDDELMNDGAAISVDVGFSKAVTTTVDHQKQAAVVAALKKSSSLLNYSGLIRYVGLLDMPTPTTTVYAGIKLDDRVGYTNGTFLGKRYFFSPDGHGVFVRLVDIQAILNTKTYEYISLSRMFRKWRKTNQKKF